MIPYTRHSMSARDIAAVAKALRNPFITDGPLVGQFEKKLASYCGAKYALVVSSGTAALHIGALVLNWKHGDQVITAPNSFLATSDVVLLCGAKIVFADTEPETGNIDPAEIKRRITRRTRGVIVTHYGGQPCRMRDIRRLTKKHGLKVMEDAAHAIGARYRHQGKWVRVGSCHDSDLVAMSFHATKNMTTGEGGAILTNDRKLYERACLYRSHGVVKDPRRFQNRKLAQGAWYYEKQSLGFNYRMTEFQAALGISQLAQLPTFLRKRRAVIRFYNQALKGIEGVTLPVEKKGVQSAWHLYPIHLDVKRVKGGRAKIFAALRKAGVGVQVHFIPIPLQPHYRRLGYRGVNFPQAIAHYETTLSLPLFPDLKKRDLRNVVRILRRALNKFRRKSR